MADYIRKVNETFNQIVNESHTMARLKKLPKSKLEDLKNEYSKKLKQAEKTGNKEKVKHHTKELHNIKKLLGEDLLNEIGETPAGQKAVKLVGVVNRERAKSADTDILIAKQFGTPEQVEIAKKKKQDFERMYRLAQQRLNPKNIEEAINLGKIKSSVVSGINKVAENMPSNKTLVNFGKDVLSNIGSAMQKEKQLKQLGKKTTTNDLTQTTLGIAGAGIKRLAIDQRQKRSFKP